MGPINKRKHLKYFVTGLIWLVLSSPAQGASLEKIELEVVQARENLRLSETTADKIAAELEELRTSGQVSPEIINDYEFYLTRVQAMVDENRKVLKEMEAAYANYVPRKKPASKDATKDLEDMLNPNIPEEQTVDEVAVLDQEFNDSLAEFDSMLLQEFDAIHARSAEKMRDLAEEAAEAAERLREKGMELSETEIEPPSAAEEGEKKTDKKATDKERDDSSKEITLDKEGASRDSSGESGQGPSREQNRTHNREDDDIVARQLREAAENETDPELKEKLWKEYEEYKKTTR